MEIVVFKYLYRDGSNYKKWGSVCFSNPNSMSLKSIDEGIRCNLIDGEWFIASEVGLPELFLFFEYGVNDDDHDYHEYSCVYFFDGHVDEVLCTIDLFIKRLFLMKKHLWNNAEDYE